MTKIELREPPTRSVSGRRPVMPLDAEILEIATDALRPVQIAERLAGRGYNVSTQRVASRLKALVGRGFMTRIRPPGAPANGPGTSLYRVKKDGDDKSDG